MAAIHAFMQRLVLQSIAHWWKSSKTLAIVDCLRVGDVLGRDSFSPKLHGCLLFLFKVTSCLLKIPRSQTQASQNCRAVSEWLLRCGLKCRLSVLIHLSQYICFSWDRNPDSPFPVNVGPPSRRRGKFLPSLIAPDVRLYKQTSEG